MRNLRQLDKYRITDPKALAYYGGWAGDDTCGAFRLDLPTGRFAVIASAGQGWDHVSISTQGRCPTWEEMDAIKRLFFRPDEWAMQLHAPPSDHINNHPYTLHLWRPHKQQIPLPPREFV